jgi:O-antigen/teichoic acid export membrane protein
MTTTTSSHRWRPIVLALLVALVGAVIAGPLGAITGVVAGLIAAFSLRLAVLAAAVALVTAAAFTLFERPLAAAAIGSFAVNRPRASDAATIATVFLLGVVAATTRDGPETAARQPDHLQPPPGTRAQQLRQDASGQRQSRRIQATPLGAAVLIGALVLWRVGDRRWAPFVPSAALATAGLVIVTVAAHSRAGRAHRIEARNPAGSVADFYRRHVHLLGGSIWLLAATLVVSLGSFLFWVVVAQQAPADDVGRATALFSATLFITYVTSLGLPIAVSRYAAARTPVSATLFTWSLVLTTASSTVGVLVFAVFAPSSIQEGLNAWHPSLGWFVVSLFVVGQSIAVLVDVRLMALRRWSLVFYRSMLIAVVRLPFVLWIPSDGAAFYIYAVAIGGFALTGLLFLLPLIREQGLRLLPLPDTSGRAAEFAVVNYVGQLALQAPYFAVPLVVLTTVDAVDNAQFYVSWGVMSVVYIGVQMIAQALLVEGGRDGADQRQQVLVTLGVSLALTTVATLAALLLGSVIAYLYGPDYESVSTLLTLLVAGTIPFSITTTLLAHSRIRERAGATLAVTAGFATSVLVPTCLLTQEHGALGAAWGWMIGNVLAALVAVVTTVQSRSRSTRARQSGVVESSLAAVLAAKQQQAIPGHDLAQAADAQDPRL